MIANLFIALTLVAITVAIHAGGISMALKHTLRFTDRLATRFWPITWLLIRIAWLLILFHLCEIAVWASLAKIAGVIFVTSAGDRD